MKPRCKGYDLMKKEFKHTGGRSV